MTQMLLWLASRAEPIDLNADKAINELHSQVIKTTVEQESILDTSMFDHDFFQILEDSYTSHLRQAIISFGQRDEMVDLLL